MTNKNLLEAQKIIDEYVNRFYPKKYKNREPILDGITDVERYINSKIKICWVLKEPYDGFNGKGGGFDLKQMLIDDLKKENHNFGKTWTPIGYISYSLLNNFLSYNQLQKLDKNIIMNSLLDISYINIGKMPAKNYTASPYKNVKDEYKIWAPILIWQLIKYNPDVIIFGNTLDFFWNDLGIDKKYYKKSKNGNYYKQYNKMFLDVYHPAVRESTISKNDYCNGIINSVKKEYLKICKKPKRHLTGLYTLRR
jgi:hypothetical protein